MKVYELQDASGIAGLNLVDRPIPVCGANDVLVRIRAITLNYRDLLTVKGRYGARQKFPLVPASDCAGVIEEVGTNVTKFRRGDRVIASFFEKWVGGDPTTEKLSRALGGSVDGVLSEYRLFAEESLVGAPLHLSDEEAAALPCAGLTAWCAVVKFGGVGPADTILTQGTGGVSLFALQFAKASGAQVIATSSTEEKIAKLKTMGANKTINYNKVPEWGKLAREMTGSRGVDLVVEVGGVGTLNESIRATRIGGCIALIGVLAGGAADDLRLPLIVMQQQRIQGVTVGSIDDLRRMVAAVSNNKIRPVIDKVFPFEDAKAAFEHMASGKHVGKVAVAFKGNA
ncbi:NAD(P)-dependent alcohol dehydrogenase [Bradyrhizobium sp. AUGA SZCCT0240]|uniref:zinc-dependent alcohol dehydrogenase family protein n=1 Tax=Bradyrhizobium sp. AUGA SZCCT0240 TaxID=2807669 RepID=UPI001BA9F3EB|nr:NAD(P)-dependent alcohol dehydrogenase [Bradyrhizobium sp. AUGA SZCCT0240]MBR1252290.1 NAD(P)-dependent alcohol dehydrogenase [Bradyrhizobium sp. AUGA SZCCT0240]